MRTFTSLLALAAGGLVTLTGTPAHADGAFFRHTIAAGAEVFVTGALKPSERYKGNVLVQLQNNPVPTEVKIGNCHGGYLGTVQVPANDHSAVIAAAASPAPTCVRYRMRNTGTSPATITGIAYY
jgi:hypothetical protein